MYITVPLLFLWKTCVFGANRTKRRGARFEGQEGTRERKKEERAAAERVGGIEGWKGPSRGVEGRMVQGTEGGDGGQKRKGAKKEILKKGGMSNAMVDWEGI
jgi:hypothetical protein